MRLARAIFCAAVPVFASGQSMAVAPAASSSSPTAQLSTQASSQGLAAVQRVYVAQLSGGAAADALRELIIASLNGTRLFILTDNPERADAVLKGAADDRTFTDSFDSDKSLSDRSDGGIYGSGSKGSKSSGGYGGMSLGDRESHHIRERKHEAYAAVRLCSRSGDVLWSTTQESLGGKFRSASADVAAKIARQILADYEALRAAPPR